MHFIYKNRSSDEFGIKIINTNNLSSPERNVETKPIDGRNGDLLIDYGNYKNFELKFECDIIPHLAKRTLKDVARDMKIWLQSDYNYAEQVISDDLETKYEAVCINKLDIERIAREFGSILIKFNCKPYKKLVDSMITVTSKNTIINNQYEISYPSIKILGAGDVIIKINQQEVVLKDIQDYIIIDSELMNAYKTTSVTNDIINQNQKMFSDFPILEQGTNNISWTGNVTKIEITPRWAVLI